METTRAVEMLLALAHDTRLAVFRLLVTSGPDGLPAGEIGEQLGVAPSTLSFHLKELDRAGLVRGARRQRRIIYAADYDGMRSLLIFLTADCCRGRPEICGGVPIIGVDRPSCPTEPSVP